MDSGDASLEPGLRAVPDAPAREDFGGAALDYVLRAEDPGLVQRRRVPALACPYSIVMFPLAVSRSRRQPPPLIVPVMFSCESEPRAVIGSSERMEPKLVPAWTL